MDILSYLSELIQTQKAVGIPGFGTIYKKKSPGRYDAETHSFLPPSYTVDFTEEVKEELLLSEFISTKRNVSADTANYFIEEFSNQLHKDLADQHQADLGNFGILKKQGDQLIFEPADGLNTGFEFFGLPAVKSAPLVKENLSPVGEDNSVVPEVLGDPAETIAELPQEETKPEVNEDDIEESDDPLAIIEEPYIKPSLEAVTVENELEEENPGQETSDDLSDQIVPDIKTEEVIWQIKKPEPVAPFYSAPAYATPPIDETAEEPEKVTPAYLKVLMAVLVILIFLAGTYILKPELFNGITGNTNPAMKPAVKPQPATLPVVQQPDTTTVIDTTKTTTASPATATRTVVKKDSLKKSSVISAQDTVVTYEIIGAAVLNKKESDYFIYQMKQSGVTAKGLPNEPGKRIKMSLGTFKDRASANAEMEKLAAKLKIKGIYIYLNKQK